MKITVDQYAKLLYEAEKTTDKKEKKALLKGVADLIKKNRDIRKMDKIENRFKILRKKESGLWEGEIVSRRKLEDKQVEAVKKAIAKEKDISEKSIELINTVDSELKGGLVIKLENEILDGSIDGKIRRIKEALAK
jgi:F-type H+-transporting ATPase subunit delta